MEIDLNDIDFGNYTFSDEHCVIISFWYGKESDDEFYEMIKSLYDFMKDSEIGRYDGHEINMDNTDGTLFFYGENAERLFKHIRPELLKYDFLLGSDVYLRFGSFNDEANDIEFKLEPIHN